ncbi:hypothetical protein ACI3KY_15280 [Microbacterium sp. ZW T2_14]|uniref:hypothetical protein n=1 Tax=Microbacterium sp. ZW T2_14 TaxID=3378079 RepID=UPI003854F550
MPQPTARASMTVTVIAVAAALSVAPGAALAVEPDEVGVFPTWSVSGSSGAFSATPTFPASAGFPATTLTSTGSTLASPSGVTAFLGAGTDFGAEYGTTRSQPYLTLSPAGSANSETTISFDGAPPAGWGFTLGDIDADWAYIEAFSTPGLSGPLPFTSLGFQSAGNYCNASPRPGACANPPYTDVPVWVTAPEFFDGTNYTPGTLRGNSLPGAPAATRDTSGAYAWFQPDPSVRSIRITFGIRDGSPSGQLWLAAPAPKVVITGTVTTPGAPAGALAPEGTVVQILEADGEPVLDIEDQPLTVPVDSATGSYTVELEQAEAGYQGAVIVPPGYIAPAPVALPGLPDDPETLTAIAPAIVVEAVPTAPSPSPSAPAPAAVPAAAPQLAASGTEVPGAIGVGAVLMAVGIALVARSARRRTAPTSHTGSR